MYAFSLEDLRGVIDIVNEYNMTGDIEVFEKMTPVQCMIFEELKKIK